MNAAASSASVALIEPVAVDVEASSVTAPVPSDPALGASLAPVIVIVTAIVSVSPDALSVTVIVNVSVTESPASRAVVSASELDSVYVHAPEPDTTAIAPYVPVASPV